MSKLLLDSNVLVYSIDEDSRFFSRARKVIDTTDKSLLTTSKNLAEFLSVITKSNGYDLNPQLALEILGEIIQGIEVIYPSYESTRVFLDLVQQYQPKGLKIHDFEIISIGLANGCHEFATFNTKDITLVKEISLLNI